MLAVLVSVLYSEGVSNDILSECGSPRRAPCADTFMPTVLLMQRPEVTTQRPAAATGLFFVNDCVHPRHEGAVLIRRRSSTLVRRQARRSACLHDFGCRARNPPELRSASAVGTRFYRRRWPRGPAPRWRLPAVPLPWLDEVVGAASPVSGGDTESGGGENPAAAGSATVGLLEFWGLPFFQFADAGPG